VGVACFAGALQGWFLRSTPAWQRAMLLAAALLLIKPGIVTDIVGFVLMAAVLAIQVTAGRRERAAAPVPPAATENPLRHG
jgi:TRAP-type uncharacterized transport system fused permease subunit